MNFKIALLQHLDLVILEIAKGTIYSGLYLIVLFLCFFIPGRSVYKLVYQKQFHSTGKNVFLSVLTGYVIYLIFSGFFVTNITTEFFWSKYQIFIIILINCFSFFIIFYQKENIINLHQLIKSLKENKLFFTILFLCFSFMICQAFWRPLPGDVDSQKNGFLIQMIFNESTFPFYPIIKVPLITQKSFYPPVSNLFLTLFLHLNFPVSSLLRASSIANLILCLVMVYIILKRSYSFSFSVLGMVISLSHVFFFEMIAMTQVSEPFAWVAMILFIYIFTENFFHEKINIRYALFLGFIFGGLIMFHGRFYKWLLIVLPLFICIRLRKGEKIKPLLLNNIAILIFGFFISALWLSDKTQFLNKHTSNFISVLYIDNFVPRSNEDSYQYIVFILYSLSFIYLLIKTAMKKSSLLDDFILSYIIMGAFTGGIVYKYYGETFIQPIVLIIIIERIISKLKLTPFLKKRTFIFLFTVIYLIFNSLPRLSRFYTISFGDYDDVRLLEKCSDSLNYETDFILNSSYFDGHWVTPISGINAVFGRKVPHVPKHGKEIIKFLENVYKSPKLNDYALLKKFAITHVFISGYHKKYKKIADKWKKIPWSRLIMQENSQNDDYPSMLFKIQ